MLIKFRRRLSTLTTYIIPKTLTKRRVPTPSPPPPFSPPPPLMATSHHHHHHHQLFTFPQTNSTILPSPSTFFSPNLLSSPLPTSAFFQNFTLKNGDQPEYIHPYLIKSSSSSLSISYPPRTATPSYIYQSFIPDLTISSSSSQAHHSITSFDDLSVTLSISPSLSCFLVRGSPYVTLSCSGGLCISTSPNTVLSFCSNVNFTKHTIKLSNNHTYLVYTSSPLRLSQLDATNVASLDNFSGIARFALLSSPSGESVLDQYSGCYPVSGTAVLSCPFSVQYRWETKGWGELLLLGHPLHLRVLHTNSCTVDSSITYNSIDGPLVGVVGNNWVLNTNPIPVTFHSIAGVSEDGTTEIISALSSDVNTLTPIATPSSYFYGKAIARAARLALIAEEVCFPDVIPAVQKFLKESITPWLDSSFNVNGFLYDPKWGGIVTKQGSVDAGADFGFGLFNDHHYHLGYFLYAIAVLSKIDPVWGRKYRPQAYAMIADILTLSRKPEAKYTRLRCFDLWKLHSWAGGLTEFADGRNQESTSEAVNAYYSAALLGMSYGDTSLVTTASTLAAFEIQAAETWWHVREGEGLYEDDFSRENRVVGVLWNNKRDSALWFAPPDWKECRLGIQVLPLLPITEVLFRDARFVKDLVNWAAPALAREGVGEGWKGFVYAMEGIYDKESALAKTRVLNGFDDGNSLSNLLWWFYSRREEDLGIGSVKGSWYGHYCH